MYFKILQYYKDVGQGEYIVIVHADLYEPGKTVVAHQKPGWSIADTFHAEIPEGETLPLECTLAVER